VLILLAGVEAEQDFIAVTLTVHWIEFLDRSDQRNTYPLEAKYLSAHT
jgi:hypothetical protein